MERPTSEAELESLVPSPTPPEQDEARRIDKPNNTEPHTTLKEQSPTWVWRVGGPLTLTLIPIGYIVLIAMVAYLHKKEENSFGNNLLEILKTAATLWPISFAAVLSPFLKSLALYCAERGATIGALEFLMTSQTTASAFQNLFLIRTHIWTTAVVLVWCLSPLGGQASIRTLDLRPNYTSIQTPAKYYMGANITDLNTFYNNSGEVAAFSGGGGRKQMLLYMRNNIAASFSRPDVTVSHANGSSDSFDRAVEALGGRFPAARLGQRDLWQNIRIRFMELLPNYDPKQPNAWIPVPKEMIVPYTSLIGIPIRGGSFSQAGNSTMMVQAHYQTLSCRQAFNETSWFEPKAFNFLFPYKNRTVNSCDPEAIPNTILDVVNSTGISEHSTINFPASEPRTKLQVALYQPIQRGSIRICEVSSTYVDIEVRCTRSSISDGINCQADRVRHTNGFPLSGNSTALSNLFAMPGIITQFPCATVSYEPVLPSSIERYLMDPPELYSQWKLKSLSDIYEPQPSNVLEARLATVLNTIIMASYTSTIITGADGTGLDDRNLLWKNTTATWTEVTNLVYVINPAWFSVWVVSTFILLIAAAANLGIRIVVKAPDILDGVSGLARDSPFVQVSHEGSGESGYDRLQKLKNTRVQIDDVKPDVGIGKIALTTDLSDRKLAWGRRYE